MGLSRKKYRKTKRILKNEGWKKPSSEAIREASSYFFPKESFKKQKLEIESFFNKKIRNITDLNTLFERLIIYSAGQISNKSMRYYVTGALKDKKRNFIFFDNAGGKTFEVWELPENGVKSLLNNDSFSGYIYAFRLKGKDHFFMKRIERIPTMHP